MKTLVKCIECENTLEISEYQEPLCDFCFHAKDCQAPKTIEFGNAWFTGAFVAKCKKCRFVSVYWECGCELEHNCQDYKGEK